MSEAYSEAPYTIGGIEFTVRLPDERRAGRPVTLGVYSAGSVGAAGFVGNVIESGGRYFLAQPSERHEQLTAAIRALAVRVGMVEA